MAHYWGQDKRKSQRADPGELREEGGGQTASMLLGLDIVGCLLGCDGPGLDAE